MAGRVERGHAEQLSDRPPAAGSPRSLSLFARFALAAGALLILTVIGYSFWPISSLGKTQPIPFSHRIHAGHKKLSCYLCHDQAMDTAVAGVPPLQTCMLCHQHIIINYPPIADLRSRYAAGETIMWRRIFKLPEHVHFAHAIHLRTRIDCGECHGDVTAMDRIRVSKRIRMGFCRDCHVREGATKDCFTCHH